MGAALGILLLGGGVTTLVADSLRPAAAAPASVARTYVTSLGDVCVLRFDPTVLGAGDPTLRTLAILELRRVELGALRLSAPDPGAEIAALTAAPEDHLDSMLRVRSHPTLHVALEAEATCSPRPVPAVASAPTPGGGTEDRPISDLGGRPPDGAGFILTSVGELCEIQVKVDLDWRSPDAGSDAARGRLREVREFYRTLDFSSVDYAAELAEQLASPLHDPSRPSNAEASAWTYAAMALVPPASGFDALTTHFGGLCGADLDG